MIIVVEGPSAVGKTTLLRQLRSNLVVSEDWAALGFPQETWPDLQTPDGQAFGVTLTAHRWKVLCESEENNGIAYADTDPLKLYYNFALVLHGSLSREQLLLTFQTYRQAMAVEQIGFADAVVFLHASTQTLWERKQQDATRRRRNFNKHNQLVDAFATYYTLLEQVRPGTVNMYDTNQHKVSSTILVQNNFTVQQYLRYDVHAFDILQQRLLEYIDTSMLQNHE